MLRGLVSVAQRIFHLLLRHVFTFLFQAELKGDFSILNSCSKPLILAANHSARIDPFLLALLPTKTIAHLTPLGFPTTINYYRHIYYRMWIAPLGAYSIPQYAINIDEFIAETVVKLRSGFVVLLFPEGKIVTRKIETNAKIGTIICAKRTGVNIIPIYIEGSSGVNWRNLLSRRVKIILTIRKPFVLNIKSEDVEICRSEAARLLNDIYEGKVM